MPNRNKIGIGHSTKDKIMKTKNSPHLTVQLRPIMFCIVVVEPSGHPPLGTEKMSMIYQHTNCFLFAVLLFSVGLFLFPAGESCAADDNAVDMIVELISGSHCSRFAKMFREQTQPSVSLNCCPNSRLMCKSS
jgi:hypothetical protein